MKKIFAIGIALLTIVSCNMDFYSSDSMTSAALKENPSSAVYTTDGIYALFKDNLAYKGQSGGEAGNIYLRHYFQLTELRGDNVTVSGTATGVSCTAGVVSGAGSSAGTSGASAVSTVTAASSMAGCCTG